MEDNYLTPFDGSGDFKIHDGKTSFSRGIHRETHRIVNSAADVTHLLMVPGINYSLAVYNDQTGLSLEENVTPYSKKNILHHTYTEQNPLGAPSAPTWENVQTYYADAETEINNVRTSPGSYTWNQSSGTPTAQSALTPNSALNAAAYYHTQDMIDRGYFAHEAPATAPYGTWQYDRTQFFGYGTTQYVTENIYSATGLGPDNPPSYTTIFQAWANSGDATVVGSHAGNMMDSAIDEYGFALLYDAVNDKWLATLVLADSTSNGGGETSYDAPTVEGGGVEAGPIDPCCWSLEIVRAGDLVDRWRQVSAGLLIETVNESALSGGTWEAICVPMTDLRHHFIYHEIEGEHVICLNDNVKGKMDDLFGDIKPGHCTYKNGVLKNMKRVFKSPQANLSHNPQKVTHKAYFHAKSRTVLEDELESPGNNHIQDMIDWYHDRNFHMWIIKVTSPGGCELKCTTAQNLEISYIGESGVRQYEQQIERKKRPAPVQLDTVDSNRIAKRHKATHPIDNKDHYKTGNWFEDKIISDEREKYNKLKGDFKDGHPIKKVAEDLEDDFYDYEQKVNPFAVAHSYIKDWEGDP